MTSAASGRAHRAASAPYVGRRRAAAAKSPRTVTLGGTTVPATAAAALSLVATGVGVAASVDGAAVAEGPATDTDTGTTVALASVRDVQAVPADISAELALRHQRASLQLSRSLQRSRLQQAAALKAAVEHRWVLPLVHYVKTSGFGYRWGALHAGEDFAAPIGTPVRAISSGVVVFAGLESGYGNKVEIRHWDGTVSWYGHLSKITVKVGERVDPAEVIGAVGSTGFSTGPHLHLEIHPDGGGPVDPLPWLRAHGLKP